MIRDLIHRHEADPEASDVLPVQELSAAAHVDDAVVVAAVLVVSGDEGARPRVQVAAIGELTAIADHKARISDVENNFVSLCVVRVLDKFKGHDVIALQPSEMTLDISEQVGG